MALLIFFGHKGNFLLVENLANEKGNTVFEAPVRCRCDSKLSLSGSKAASRLTSISSTSWSTADKTDQYFLGVKQPQSLLVYLHGVQRKKQINNIRGALLTRAPVEFKIWNPKLDT
jgi:hypothetical protein